MQQQTGETAEAYVYYRLLSWGYDVQLASGISSPFDLILVHKARRRKRTCLIQVKGTAWYESTEKKTRTYRFSTAKGGRKKYTYECNDFDILAMVALPEERAFFTDQFQNRKTQRIKPEKFDEQWEKKTWGRCFDRWLEQN